MQMPVLACFAMVFLSGCGILAPEARTTVTLPLRIQGTVSSSQNGAVIAGATVTLGAVVGANTPSVRQSTQADTVGVYGIQDLLTFNNVCPFLWVRAEAAGYVTSSIEDSRFAVACTSQTQTINIILQPAP